ncbi:MAG: hypothetical protein LBP89_10090 [Helicobacteraceae bacterium]|jgi:hypothetical protein|nr:hypothetical protein [Helicobacteraceae bacterium]
MSTIVERYYDFMATITKRVADHYVARSPKCRWYLREFERFRTLVLVGIDAQKVKTQERAARLDAEFKSVETQDRPGYANEVIARIAAALEAGDEVEAKRIAKEYLSETEEA